MQLVSPILNDALAAAGVSGADFLREFDRVCDGGGVWIARHSALPGLAGSPVRAKLWGDDIVAEATLAPGVFMDETTRRGLLRVPLNLPATVDVALEGRPIGQVVCHPLTGRPGALIERVTTTADGRERLLSYAAPREPLLP